MAVLSLPVPLANSPGAEPEHAARGKAPVALSTGLLILALGVTAVQPAAARPAPESFADLTAEVAPAVVNVSVVTRGGSDRSVGMPDFNGLPFEPNHPFRDFFERFFNPNGPLPPGAGPNGSERGRPLERTGAGSGFIIDPQGYVVTNHHVIAGADEITVTLHDGRSLEADLVGQDEKTDLALLRVEAEGPLPFVAFGDSDTVRPGDWVIAVGNPFGLGGSVTAGIVSARGRDLPGGSIIDFLQLDAPINKGNSGGPAFDSQGRVIGVNTAIFSPNGGSVGIGFAIPSNLASDVVAALRADGKVSRGWLGVRVQTVTPEMAEAFHLDEAEGALIASIEPGSPAADAGLESGDVILSWDGQAVDRLKDLPRLVAFTPAGKTVAVEVWRNGKAIMLTAITGHAPEAQRVAAGTPSPAGNVELAGTGLTVGPVTDERRGVSGTAEPLSGAMVIGVASNSAAAREGLRRGDVIRRLGAAPVNSVRDALDSIERVKAEGDKVVTLLVSRDGIETFFALRLEDA